MKKFLWALFAFAIYGCTDQIKSSVPDISDPISFSATSFSLDADGRAQTFTVDAAEGVWNVSPSADWLHVTPKNGTGSVKVSVSADVNHTDIERSAAMEFTMPGYFSGVISLPVTQAAGYGEEPGPGPGPDPGPGGGDEPGSVSVPVWYELPAMDATKSDKYVVSASDPNLYYAWHITDVEGPGNRKARNYTTCFSAQTHVPLWIAAPLHSMYRSGVKRQDAYKNDPDIPGGLTGIQYTAPGDGGSGCNKGHMLGSSDRLASRLTNQQVFYSSNIAPQLSNFNTGGGGWNTVEDWVDTQLCSDTLYVVIGTYYDRFQDKWGNPELETRDIEYGGRTDVKIPTMFYYVLLRTKNGNSGKKVTDCTSDELQCVAVVRAHTNDLKSQIDRIKNRTGKPYVYTEDLMSVSELEALTGFTYFSNVPNAPKDTYNPSDWDITKNVKDYL